MSWRRMGKNLRLWCGLAWLSISTLSTASEYHGQVTLAGLPVPGVTVTVTATQGSKKVAAITDAQGVFSFPDLTDGTWAVRVEMTGFAPVTQDVTVSPDAPAGKFEIKMLSLDEVRAAIKPAKVEAKPVETASAPVPTPAAAKSKDNKATAAVETPAPAPAAQDENSAKAADGLLINGSVNNAATSQFAMSQAFGNTRNGGKSLYNSSLGLMFENSALDAKQYSLTGLDTAKPSYNRVTGTASFGGPIKIPHLVRRGPNFFIGYQWTRNQNDSTVSALVPDLAQRAGNLSETTTPIFNPLTGIAYAGNQVPITAQNQKLCAALPSGSTQSLPCLLNYYPLPNLSGSTRYNYQAPLVSSTHSDSVQMRMDKSVTPRNQLNGQFAFQTSRSSNQNLFNFVDTTNFLGLNTNISWNHRIKQRLFVTLGYNFSRSRTQGIPFFANRADVSQDAGITGNDRDPLYWGPPSLSFSSGIYPLSDGQSSFNRNETNGISLNLSWNHGRHNLTGGGDVRRLEFNYLSQQNPRGSLTFTGAATQGGTNSATLGGSDFADFLLGIPDVSSIAFGNADKYLRQGVYDVFFTDDWRVRPDLTINAGIRWEYGSPITELKNRLVNLDAAPGFSAVTPLLASAPLGSLSGQHYPNSLIRPDRVGIEPRVGLSWRPISGSSVVVRAGYGIYDDTSVYQATALAMAQQAPLSTSLSVSNSAACRFYITNPFNVPCSTTTADNFAVDPNFRVGYANTWQLSVQRDLPRSLQMTVNYLGIKGTRGVQQFLPNTSPLGATNPCSSCPNGFTYRTSGGNSTREEGRLELRRRLRNGFTATLRYTYSKSIDDDSVLGGQGPVATGAGGQSSSASAIAQNWLDLPGERGLSTFDQRHLMTLNMQYTTGMGIGGRALMSGWKGVLYKEWTVVTNITVGSGLPETPTYLAAVSGTGFTNIERPSVTGQNIYSAPAGLFLNPAAYTAPAAGQWGNARRNSIEGPDQFSLNASMARTFRLHDRYSLDARIDTTNTLNHVAYTGWVTTVNSSQFGLPVSTNGMRTAQGTLRLRF